MVKVGSRSIFLTPIWLLYGQLCAILKGDSLTNLMLITAFSLVQPKGHRSEVGSLSKTERLVRFEPEIFDSKHNSLTN